MKSQTDRLYDLLKSGEPYRTDQIQILIYGGNHLGLARVGARCWDIKKKYGVSIKSWPDKEIKSLWWYQLLAKPIAISIAKEEKPKDTLFELPEVERKPQIMM